MDRKLILGLDYNNLIYASFYDKELINSKQMNVNAINGFFFKLKRLKEFLNPDHIVVCNDMGREKTFRRKLYPEYKNNRSITPSGISEQIPYGLRILSALGYPVINNDNYEADDMLGMVSRYAMDNNMDMIIASSDKDFFQLITDNVTIFNMRYQKIIDANWIWDKYELKPNQLIDLKGLIGDKSDNIPGAYGIGERTGLYLLHQFKSLEGIYKNLDLIKPVLRSRIESDRQIIELSMTLGTILTDYNIIGLNESMLNRQEPDIGELQYVINDLELPQLHNVMRYTLLHNKLINTTY